MSSQAAPPTYLQYSTVLGYFLQDDPDTDASTFDYTTTNFGLKPLSQSPSSPKTETQWQIFADIVAGLNRAAGSNTHYKVLFLGRHGEGVHNVAEAYYGTPMWDCKYSLLPGNTTTTWSDAHLTATGITQAHLARDTWAHQLSTEKTPAPQSYYVSPLDRCLATARETFSTLALPADCPFVPTVKEFLRETTGLHTCDRRSSRTYIHATYPGYVIPPEFAEEDPLWSPEERESDSALDARVTRLLDDVFATDRNTWVSFTSHSGAIAGLLRVLGHRAFALRTGAVLPVLVRAEIVRGQRDEREGGGSGEVGMRPPECIGEVEGK